LEDEVKWAFGKGKVKSKNAKVKNVEIDISGRVFFFSFFLFP